MRQSRWFCAVLTMAILTLLSAIDLSAQQAKGPSRDTPAAPRYKVGDTAPDFTLKDQNGKDVSLRDFRGKKSVALAFFVFAFTGG